MGEAANFAAPLLQQCDTLDLGWVSWAKCTIIVHEMTHTKHAMLDEQASLDVAYGYTDCTLLRNGEFDWSCAPYADPTKPPVCPVNGLEGLCPATFSGDNADTYSIVAGAVYFSQKCGKTIPPPPPRPNSALGVGRRDVGTVGRTHPRELSIPVEPATGALLQRRGTSCPDSTDAWAFDDDADDTV